MPAWKGSLLRYLGCLGNLGQRIQHSVNPWLVQKMLQLTVQFAQTDLYTLSRAVHRIKEPNKAIAPLAQKPRKRGTRSPQLLLLGQCFPLSQLTIPFCHTPWLFFFICLSVFCWISPCKPWCPASSGSAPPTAQHQGDQAGCEGPVGGQGLGPGAPSLWRSHEGRL